MLTPFEEFLTMPKEMIVNVIKNDELEVTDELIVYQAVRNWIRHDVKNRAKVIKLSGAPNAKLGTVNKPWDSARLRSQSYQLTLSLCSCAKASNLVTYFIHSVYFEEHSKTQTYLYFHSL